MPFVILKKNHEHFKPLKNADDSKKRIFLEKKMYYKTESLKAVHFASQVD
jgi:hypothetical protein